MSLPAVPKEEVSMENQANQVAQLLTEIRCALEKRAGLEVVQQTLDRLLVLDLEARFVHSLTPQIPAKFDKGLTRAIDRIPASLEFIAQTLDTARPYLYWQPDGGQFYEEGSDVGHSYREGNMICTLVGPVNSFFYSNDLFICLFFLQSRTLYRDHVHEASEMYFNLTGPCGFRLGNDDWVDYPGDSLVWNRPWDVHATRVYQAPFLSVVSWVGNINGLCRVVPRDDWLTLQSQLATH
jgi:hypothetical protein